MALQARTRAMIWGRRLSNALRGSNAAKIWRRKSQPTTTKVDKSRGYCNGKNGFKSVGAYLNAADDHEADSDEPVGPRVNKRIRQVMVCFSEHRATRQCQGFVQGLILCCDGDAAWRPSKSQHMLPSKHNHEAMVRNVLQHLTLSLRTCCTHDAHCNCVAPTEASHVREASVLGDKP